MFIIDVYWIIPDFYQLNVLLLNELMVINTELFAMLHYCDSMITANLLSMHLWNCMTESMISD